MNKDVLILYVPNYTYKKLHWTDNVYMLAIGLFSICNVLNKNNISAEIINCNISQFFAVFDTCSSKDNSVIKLINILEKELYKKISIQIECYKLTTEKLVDLIVNSL